MVESEVESESLKKAQLVLEKVTAVQEGLVKTLDQISTAVDQNKLVDLASLHSQAPSGDACQIQDLEPAAFPPGSDRLEELKLEAESGQEQCEQKAAAAKVTLKILDAKAKKLDAAGLALTKENHLSSQLEDLKKVTEKTAEVFGDAHQVKGMDEVLETAGVSSSLSKASKEEEYEKLSKLLIKKYFEALNEVSLELILQNGLPMELDEIVAILDECGAVQQIGEAAGQGRKEVQRVNDDLKKHLDARLQQALVISLYNPLFFLFMFPSVCICLSAFVHRSCEIMSICSYSATRSEPRFPSRNSKSSARREKRMPIRLRRHVLQRSRRLLKFCHSAFLDFSDDTSQKFVDALIDQFCENHIM